MIMSRNITTPTINAHIALHARGPDIIANPLDQLAKSPAIRHP
jgi:hypothetical protein